VLRLEDEVVVLVRPQQLDERASRHSVLETVTDDLAKVRSPLPVVVVDVDRRDAGGPGAALQLAEAPRHRERVGEERLPAVEVEVVDDVEQQQRDGRLVRDHPVEIFVAGGHVTRVTPDGRADNPGPRVRSAGPTSS